MSDKNKIRDIVSVVYANAVTRQTISEGKGSGCCGAAPKGVAANIVGYAAEELAGIPDDAVVNSFGCGNPLAYGDVKEGETVLDLGSGAGIDILLAAGKVGPSGRVIGVDMTDEMIERAEKNIEASGLRNVEVRRGLIEEMPVESGSVDWVISNCVINLSPEKDKVFGEISRVLKPGGRFLISDIVVEDLPEWAREDKALYCSCVSGAISEEEYMEGLRRAGLVDVEVRDRLVYDTMQLTGLIEFELADVEPVKGGSCGTGCCGAEVSGDSARKLTDQMAGKIWSAKFYGRKP